MKRGTKIFVFATAMLLTVGVLKATIGHRYGFGQMGGCHNERLKQKGAMENCHGFNCLDDTKSNSEITPTPNK